MCFKLIENCYLCVAKLFSLSTYILDIYIIYICLYKSVHNIYIYNMSDGIYLVKWRVSSIGAYPGLSKNIIIRLSNEAGTPRERG